VDSDGISVLHKSCSTGTMTRHYLREAFRLTLDTAFLERQERSCPGRFRSQKGRRAKY